MSICKSSSSWIWIFDRIQEEVHHLLEVSGATILREQKTGLYEASIRERWKLQLTLFLKLQV